MICLGHWSTSRRSANVTGHLAAGVRCPLEAACHRRSGAPDCSSNCGSGMGDAVGSMIAEVDGSRKVLHARTVRGPPTKAASGDVNECSFRTAPFASKRCVVEIQTRCRLGRSRFRQSRRDDSLSAGGASRRQPAPAPGFGSIRNPKPRSGDRTAAESSVV